MTQSDGGVPLQRPVAVRPMPCRPIPMRPGMQSTYELLKLATSDSDGDESYRSISPGSRRSVTPADDVEDVACQSYPAASPQSVGGAYNNNKRSRFTEQAVRIEQEEDDMERLYRNAPQHQSPHPVVVRPQPIHLHRPVAVKVIRPMSKAVVEEFYSEVHQHQDVSAADITRAFQDAHEWHRKWTLQEEVGHTMPEDNHLAASAASSNDGAASFPLRYAMDASLMDRACGAKNPSPEETHMFVDRMKRSRMGGSFSDEFENSLSSLSSLDDSSLQMQLQRQLFEDSTPAATKRRVSDAPGKVTREASVDRETQLRNHPQPLPPVHIVQPIKPVALRIARPAALYPLQLQQQHGEVIDSYDSRNSTVPEHVMHPSRGNRPAHHSGGASTHSLSPLTLPSVGSACGNRRSNGQQTKEESTTGRTYNLVEDEEQEGCRSMSSSVSAMSAASGSAAVSAQSVYMLPALSDTLLQARDGMLHALAVTRGDYTDASSHFDEHLQALNQYFSNQLQIDTRLSADGEAALTEGMWLTLTKPTFFGCLGENDAGDPLYTLGRMSFDMFSPTSLVCSLQGNFNSIEYVSEKQRLAMLANNSIPKALREEVETGNTHLRTYNVVTAFTIEPNLAAYPNAPNKDVRRPIRCIMTTFGYTLPDPETPNRHSVWITGGRIEPNDSPEDQAAWKTQFAAHPPKHGLGEQAKLLAVKLLMGANIPKEMAADGSLEYTFSRPLGGHGMAYIDVLYCDETLRVVRGHRGTVFVFSRLPGSKGENYDTLSHAAAEHL